MTMLKQIRFPALMSCLGILLLGAGCESGDNPDPEHALRIDPSEVRFSQQTTTVTLRAVNGRPPYLWRVSDENMGKITGVPEDAGEKPTAVAEVNYQRVPGETGVNTVTVIDRRGWSATARMIAPAPGDLP